MRWGGIAGAILSVGALVSGAVSVSRLAFPAGAEVEAAAIRCLSDRVELAVQNSGDRAAFIEEATILAAGFHPDGKPWEAPVLWLELSPDAGATGYPLLSGHSSTIFQLEARHRRQEGLIVPIVPKGASTADRCQYRIQLKIKGISQAKPAEPLQITCACSS